VAATFYLDITFPTRRSPPPSPPLSLGRQPSRGQKVENDQVIRNGPFLSRALTQKFHFLQKHGYLKLLFRDDLVHTKFGAKHGRTFYEGVPRGAFRRGADTEGCVVGYGRNRSRSHAPEECPPPRGLRGLRARNDVSNQFDCRPWAELPGTAYAFVVGVGFGSGGMSPHSTAVDLARHPGELRRSFGLKTHGSARGL